MISWIKREKVQVILLLLLGAVLRLYALGAIPGGYHRDEAYAAWNALNLFHDGIDSSGHSFPVYFEAWAHGQSALYDYLLLPLIALAQGHMNPVILRIPQAVVGILTLFACYYLLRKMFSKTVAIWGLFLLLICPWHVMMSRWGLDANLAPGFLMFGLAFFIKGLEKPIYYLWSGLFYGLSLYAYALTWPILPVILLLQILYCLRYHKIRWSKWLATGGIILLLLALPLILFLLVNMGVLPPMKIGAFSIYRMTSFRSGELGFSLGEIWKNIRNTIYFLRHQDIGMPYEVIMPYGIFYVTGWIFLIGGAILVLVRMVHSGRRKAFAYEWFILVQLLGAGLIGCFVQVSLHKLNMLYIPIIMCQAYGIDGLTHMPLIKQKIWLRRGISGVILGSYLVQLTGFQIAYYTDYKSVASAYFQEGSDACVKDGWQAALEQGKEVYVDAGLKYPNVLLAVEGTAEEYLQTLTYSDNRPAPAEFSAKGVVFHMGIDYENLSPDSIYVLYYSEKDRFWDYTLTAYYDWYVAVPKGD
jgi:4-amino-4-deoxy-L-arabinose transferase-like glycosyltransferase